MGGDRSVGIATRNGLRGPGIESRWGRVFPHRSRPFHGPTQPPIQWVSGDKAAGLWRWPPTQPSAEVKERVGLYLSYLPRSSRPVRGWNMLYFTTVHGAITQLRECNNALRKRSKQAFDKWFLFWLTEEINKFVFLQTQLLVLLEI